MPESSRGDPAPNGLTDEHIRLVKEAARLVAPLAEKFRPRGMNVDAQDIQQTVLLKFIRALERGRFGGEECSLDKQLERWLAVVTPRAAIDAGRKVRREGPATGIDQLEAGGSSDPYVRLQFKETLALALRPLDDEERRAFILREIHGCTWAEVAVTLGGTEAGWRTRMWRAMRAVRALLIQEEGSAAEM